MHRGQVIATGVVVLLLEIHPYGKPEQHNRKHPKGGIAHFRFLRHEPILINMPCAKLEERKRNLHTHAMRDTAAPWGMSRIHVGFASSTLQPVDCRHSLLRGEPEEDDEEEEEDDEAGREEDDEREGYSE